MTLRSDPDLRAAYDKVRDHKREQRKVRKAASIAHVRAVVSSQAPGKRQPRERDNGYLAFLRRQPCAICRATPCDAAHLRFTNLKVGRTNPGMGQKSHDRFATALCRLHHTEQHDAGNEAAWWASHGIDPDALAARLYAAFLAGDDIAAGPRTIKQEPA